MRKFLPPSEGQGQYNPSIRPTLRTNNPAAGYARRSDPYAKDEEKDKTQSREMQTEDLREWAVAQAWKEKDFHPYFADLGLSGTLRPDQRPDMLRLFDDIDSGKYDHGSVICYQENRLFRDETQIYYNQFIQKCLEHDIVVVVVSPYLMIYDFRDDMLTEMFRWKCKEAADFIKRHVKGWMLPARIRAAWVDGEWAGLGQLPPGFIVDFNPESKTYKKFIPYWPHAEKKRELYQLFVELGCDTSLLYQRLRKVPIIFPDFEAWVDQRNVNKFGMSKHPSGGYYPKSKATLVAMLTDPNNIGYRAINGVIRHNRQGEKIKDHDPIIDRETFDLVYYKLAHTDLDGNPIEGKKERRYFQQDTTGKFGLLKYRITSTQGSARTHHTSPTWQTNASLEKGFYIIEHPEQEHGLHHRIYHAAIRCYELDTIIVNRLMEHIRVMSHSQQDMKAYEERIAKIREERQKKLKQLEKSIKDINSEQGGLTRSLGKLEQEIEEAEREAKQKIDETERAKEEEKVLLKQRRKELIEEQIDTLEVERQKLIRAKAEVQEEAESDLGSLDEELEKLEALWTEYTFEKRRSLINFLIREVAVDTVSTHWVHVQVTWLHEEWGKEEMYFYREEGSSKRWTEEEIAILRSHYTTMPKLQLMALLPDRAWQSIRWYGKQMLGIPRKYPKRSQEEFPQDTSYSDLLFMREKGISYNVRYTKWESLNALAVLMFTN